MLTSEEIRAQWKDVRQSIGTLVGYIEGKTQQLPDLEAAWNRGYDIGHSDGVKQGSSFATDLYKNGFNDAWSLVADIGTYPDDVLDDLFGVHDYTNVVYGIVCKYTPKQVMDRLREYEEEKMNTIRMGDEVEADDTGKAVRFIAWMEECGEVTGIDESGGHYTYPTSQCKKTGRHFSISFTKQGETDG